MDARRIILWSENRAPVSSAPALYPKSTRIDRKPRSQQTLRVTPDKPACGKLQSLPSDGQTGSNAYGLARDALYPVIGQEFLGGHNLHLRIISPAGTGPRDSI